MISFTEKKNTNFYLPLKNVMIGYMYNDSLYPYHYRGNAKFGTE